MICPQCHGERASTEIRSTGIVFRCLNDSCRCEFNGGDARPPQQIAADVQSVQSEPPMVRPQAAATRKAPAKPTDLLSCDVLKLARQQLKELNVEIARLEKLKQQRDELKRFLAAAKPKRDGQAIVRPLRSAKQG